MISISVKADFETAIRKLDIGVRRQVPFAIKNTLNKLALDVKTDVVNEMRVKFDRPTPFTLNSLFIKYATKQTLTARVYVKDKELFKSRAFNEQLAHEFAGGERIRKRLEYWFQRAGYISSNEYLVPGESAQLDAFGNMSRGQIQKILSQLRAGPDVQSHKTNSRRSRAKRIDVEYFWSRGGRLKRGVWARYRLGFGSSVKPLLIVVGHAAYVRKIDIDRIGNARVNRDFNDRFAIELQKAIATAR